MSGRKGTSGPVSYEKILQKEKEHFRICLETLLKSLINLSKKLLMANWTPNFQTLRGGRIQCSIEKIQSRKATGLKKILLEVSKRRKFDDILLWLYNAVYKQSTIEKLTQCSILPFPKKSDLRITKNYIGKTLIVTAAKVKISLLLNWIRPEEKILRKNQVGFQRNRSTTSQILKVRRIIGVRSKNFEATLLLVDFPKAFESIYRGKMKQILITHGLSKETDTAVVMRYKNTKAMVRSPNRRHKLLWHCHWSLVGRYISIISIHNLPRLRITNVNTFNERKWSRTKKR